MTEMIRGVEKCQCAAMLEICCCIDCDKLKDGFVISPFDTSLEINLSNVALVCSLTLVGKLIKIVILV